MNEPNKPIGPVYHDAESQNNQPEAWMWDADTAMWETELAEVWATPEEIESLYARPSTTSTRR